MGVYSPNQDLTPAVANDAGESTQENGLDSPSHHPPTHQEGINSPLRRGFRGCYRNSHQAVVAKAVRHSEPERYGTSFNHRLDVGRCVPASGKIELVGFAEELSNAEQCLS